MTLKVKTCAGVEPVVLPVVEPVVVPPVVVPVVDPPVVVPVVDPPVLPPVEKSRLSVLELVEVVVFFSWQLASARNKRRHIQIILCFIDTPFITSRLQRPYSLSLSGLGDKT